MCRILVTGASGFLGQYIIRSLSKNTGLITLGRSLSNSIICDLSSSVPVLKQVDLVIHGAGKAHQIPKTVAQINDFYLVNYQATVNLTKALELSHIPKALVYISTVAVYGVEEGELVSEDHPLNGDNPYAISKIQAEEFLSNWCNKKNVKLTILRLPLIVGANAPGNLGTIVKWIRTGLYMGIGDGATRKSMVLAEDVANFIPHVTSIGGVYNLTDGHHPSMVELENSIAGFFKKRNPPRFPEGFIKFIARVGDFMGQYFPLNTMRYRKLTSTLTFSDLKARKSAGWRPRSVVEHIAL